MREYFLNIQWAFILFFCHLTALHAVTGTWTDPVDLSAEGENAEHPYVVMDSDGNATAIWRRFNGDVWVIQAASAALGEDWSDPTTLSSTDVDSDAQAIGVDMVDNVTATWQQETIDPDDTLQLSNKVPGLDWADAEALTPAEEIINSALSVNGRGDIFIVAQVVMGGQPFVQAIYKYSDEEDFTVETISFAASSFPNIIVDNNGNATATWIKNFQIQALTKLVGLPWPDPDDAVTISNELDYDNNIAVQLIVDSNNCVTAAWSAHNNVTADFEVVSISQTSVGMWPNPATDLSVLSGTNGGSVKLTINEDNAITAIWVRTIDGKGVIQTSTKSPGGDWPDPNEAVDLSDNQYTAASPAIATDGDDNTFAVWALEDIDAHTFIIQAMIREDEDWPAPDEATTLTPPGDSTLVPQVAADDGGNATVVWQSSNGLNSIIQASQYLLPLPPDPPGSVSGYQMRNIFLTQTDIINKLSWTAPEEGPAPAFYAIGRSEDHVEDIELIATVSGDTYQYVDHNRRANEVYTYYVVAVDADGGFSNPATITIYP